jgi:dephospho-CoA kinase
MSIVMSGLAGSGKSTIAEAGRVRGCPVLSVDHIKSAIVGSGGTRSFETGLAAYRVARRWQRRTCPPGSMS